MPLPPLKTLSWALPVIESLKAEPITLRMPLIDVKPVAVPEARLTVTPVA